MPLSTEIGQIGEKLVAEYLKNVKGYHKVIQNTKGPGATDIEAIGTKIRLLVQVKTAVLPNEPSCLTSDEENRIKSRAASMSAEAWEARVMLDSQHKPTGQFKWRKLS